MSATMFVWVALLLALASQCAVVHAAGGMAEMKALTGDAPYLGTGNQEQAPEYFGPALYRQYYSNPAYGNRYWSNYYNSLYAPYYARAPYRDLQQPPAPSNVQPPVFASNIAPVAPPSSPITSPIEAGGPPASSGGFYKGQGNDWDAKKN